MTESAQQTNTTIWEAVLRACMAFLFFLFFFFCCGLVTFDIVNLTCISIIAFGILLLLFCSDGS